MPRGPSKYLRRRKRAHAPVVREAAPVALPPAAVGWCEQHECEVPPGSEEHAGCVVRALHVTVRGARDANVSVYFDEASGNLLLRYPTGWEGVDRALGGGFVKDSIVMFIGETGAGKSTWLLQVLALLLARGVRVLYVAAEESTTQVGDRAKRLKVDHLDGRIIHTTSFAEFTTELARLDAIGEGPDVVVVDSAQAIGWSDGTVPGAIGSVGQSLEVIQRCKEIAKGQARCFIVVNTENKEGGASGSQQAQHIVDVVLILGMDGRARRFLRGKKNRFGETNETVAYDMTATGLREIGNITEEHLEYRLGDVGVVPFAAAHLARPVLLAVEASAVQIDDALQARPIEVDGYDRKRVLNIIDRLQIDCGCYTKDRILRVKVPRILGEEIDDEEIDLAIAAALLSALHNRPPPKALIFGSVGIAGHVTSEFRAEMRLAAARDHKRLAFREAIVPFRANGVDRVKITRVRHMNELMPALWGVNIAMPRPPREEKPDALAA